MRKCTRTHLTTHHVSGISSAHRRQAAQRRPANRVMTNSVKIHMGSAGSVKSVMFEFPPLPTCGTTEWCLTIVSRPVCRHRLTSITPRTKFRCWGTIPQLLSLNKEWILRRKDQQELGCQICVFLAFSTFPARSLIMQPSRVLLDTIECTAVIS